MSVIEIVKYEGPDPHEVFAWKYLNSRTPASSCELSTWTQLVVREYQEAILFRNGQALDLFGPGRHTLKSDNVPLLRKVVNLPFSGESPFKAEVWFVNRLHSLDVKWGTAEPIQLRDPAYGIVLPVRAYGQFGISVEDSRKFLLKLVGSVEVFDRKNLVRHFRGLLMTKARDLIASYLIEKKITVLEVNAHLDEISTDIGKRISPLFGEYGIRVLNFFVNSINVPDDDPAVEELRKTLSEKARMDIMGYDYRQRRTFDTLESAAGNSGTGGNLANAGMGLGIGLGVGGAMGGLAGQMANQMNLNASKRCPACDTANPPEAKFCIACGKPLQEVREEADICSSCGKSIPRGSRFCPHCGKSQISVCPECGREIDPEDAFCPHCGIRIGKAEGEDR